MNTLLDNTIPHLDSLDTNENLDLEQRLQILEASFTLFSNRLETRLLAKIRQLEDALTDHSLRNRKELDGEAAERHEQIATIATKICQKIDALNVDPAAPLDLHLTSTIQEQINEARERIAREANELRASIKAQLEDPGAE